MTHLTLPTPPSGHSPTSTVLFILLAVGFVLVMGGLDEALRKGTAFGITRRQEQRRQRTGSAMSFSGLLVLGLFTGLFIHHSATEGARYDRYTTVSKVAYRAAWDRSIDQGKLKGLKVTQKGERGEQFEVGAWDQWRTCSFVRQDGQAPSQNDTAQAVKVTCTPSQEKPGPVLYTTTGESI